MLSIAQKTFPSVLRAARAPAAVRGVNTVGFDTSTHKLIDDQHQRVRRREPCGAGLRAYVGAVMIVVRISRAVFAERTAGASGVSLMLPVFRGVRRPRLDSVEIPHVVAE
eukprot:1176560-Prorocentrum_minimum.AAC.2